MPRAHAKKNDPTRDWTVRIDRSDGGSSEGGLVETSHDALVVKFKRDVAPTLEIGRGAVLVLAGGGPEAVLATRVVSRTEEPDALRYRFQLTDPAGPDVKAIFNSRRAVRARPGDGTPVLVTLEGAGHVATGDLHDISRLGLAVLLELEHEPAFAQARTLSARFELPGDAEPYELVGRVRQRTMQGDRVRYGLEFDPRSTTDFRPQEERIARYAQSRQREALHGAEAAAGRG